MQRRVEVIVFFLDCCSGGSWGSLFHASKLRSPLRSHKTVVGERKESGCRGRATQRDKERDGEMRVEQCKFHHNQTRACRGEK